MLGARNDGTPMGVEEAAADQKALEPLPVCLLGVDKMHRHGQVVKTTGARAQVADNNAAILRVIGR